MVWMLDACAIRLGNAEGTRDRENHNQPEQNSKTLSMVLAGAFGSWSESLGEGSNLPYLHDLRSRYWDSLPS